MGRWSLPKPSRVHPTYLTMGRLLGLLAILATVQGESVTDFLRSRTDLSQVGSLSIALTP